MPKQRQRFVPLIDLLRTLHPDVEDPEAAVVEGLVTVDGTVLRNARASVGRDAVVKVQQQQQGLRGAKKLVAALDHFGVPVEGRVALDLGASTGGFSSVLVERGARLVYSVDVGFGQLLGSLRQHPRVRNLERTNIADLTVELVPDVVDVATMDLSYVAIATAVPQVESVRFAPDADLLALVKPMYELRLGDLPTRDEQFAEAVALATAGVDRCPWSVRGVVRSPVPGSRGAAEFLLHATRRLPPEDPSA